MPLQNVFSRVSKRIVHIFVTMKLIVTAAKLLVTLMRAPVTSALRPEPRPADRPKGSGRGMLQK